MKKYLERKRFSDHVDLAGFTTLKWEDDHHAFELVADFYQRFAQLLEAGKRDSAPMILDVHLIDRVGFNAFAGSFAEGDVIAIYRDVPLLLLKLARALVSHGHILPEIKTLGLSVDPVAVPGTLRELLGAVRVWEVAPLSDPLRENVAQQLARLAGQYVMAHEFAHVYFGHVDYLNAHLGLSLMAEIKAEGLPSPVTIERETLEWDADAMASQSILQTATQPLVNIVAGRAVWAIPGKNAIGTRDEAIQLAIIAPAMCTIFFGDREIGDPRDLSPRSHPHPMFRFLTSFEMVVHVLSFRADIRIEEITPLLEPAATSFAESLAATIVKPKTPRQYEITEDEVTAAYVARLKIWNESWARIHPELEILKRGGTLAPAVPGQHPAFPHSSVVG